MGHRGGRQAKRHRRHRAPGDGTLLLTPRLEAGKEVRRKIFDLEDEPGEKELLRKLIGAYVTGHDIIEVVQKPRMSTKVRGVVRRFTQLVIGPEIIDEGLDNIKTRDLLDPSDLPFRTSIRRMYRIVSSMHREAALACMELDLHLAEDVISRDTEVDRLDWLVARQYNLLIKDMELTEKIGTSREHAVNFLLISRIMERIGDHSARMARQVTELKKAKVKRSLLKEIGASSEAILPVLDDVVSALFERDGRLAQDCMERANGFLEELNDLKSKIADAAGGGRLALGIVTDSLERTAHYTKDIGELVINYSIDAT